MKDKGQIVLHHTRPLWPTGHYGPDNADIEVQPRYLLLFIEFSSEVTEADSEE